MAPRSSRSLGTSDGGRRVDPQDPAERERAPDHRGDEQRDARSSTSRGGVTANGIEPAGISASSATAAAMPIGGGDGVTTTAWRSTPAKIVAELAPRAFRTP